MYGFEIMSELHLTAEQLASNKKDFQTIFQKTLQDESIKVRVSALKAITAFISGIDDQDVVMEFEPILGLLLQTVVKALEFDEEQGQHALESMSELTGAHPEVWKSHTGYLLEVVAQIVSAKQLDAGTRSAAIEVVLSLSSEMPAALRKAPETSTKLFPALVQMLTEVEEDEATWVETVENKEMLGSDPYSIAVSQISRLVGDLGEKKTLEAAQPLISKCIQSQHWQERQAGFTLSGLIAEPCKEFFKKNLGEVFGCAKQGVSDAHYRVKYAGLSAMAMMYSECAP